MDTIGDILHEVPIPFVRILGDVSGSPCDFVAFVVAGKHDVTGGHMRQNSVSRGRVIHLFAHYSYVPGVLLQLKPRGDLRGEKQRHC